MELRLIEYAIAVADHGGFSRAAEALYVSQPSVSQGVRSLERELGVELFHRLGRSVLPTSAGEAFLESARRIVRDVQSAREAAAAVAGLRSGRLDLAALPTLAADPLAPLGGAFRREFPGVSVRILQPEVGRSADALVRSGRAELGLSEVPVEDEDLVSEPVLVQELLAVCPPGFTLPPAGRIAVGRLRDLPIVTGPPGTSTRRLLERAFAAASARALVAVETDEREAILPLVLAGAGATLLPAPQAEDAARRGAVVAPLRPRVRRTIGLVFRRAPLSPAAREFVRIVRRSYGRRG
jgi:LysR family carnitine catabolism transcriptional activator